MPPSPQVGVQDGSYGPICIQAPIKGPQLTGPGASSPIGQAVNQFLGGIPVPSFTAASEGALQHPHFWTFRLFSAFFRPDCLFLDVYVPASAVQNPTLKLPVISWFYGGAYTFGGKDSFEPVLPFYDGSGIIQESDGNVIFVASNYRVLSGTKFYNVLKLKVL